VKSRRRVRKVDQGRRLGFQGFSHDSKKAIRSTAISRSLRTPKVEGKLALREPTGLAMGIGFPIILLDSIRPHWKGSAGSRRYRPTVLDIRSNKSSFIGFYSSNQFPCLSPVSSGDGVATKSLNDSNTSLKTTRSFN